MLHIDPDCRKKLHTFYRIGLFERIALLTKRYQFFALRVMITQQCIFTLLIYSTVKILITNTSEEFIKCRLDNVSMSFRLYFVYFSICENKEIAMNMREQF